MALRPYRRRVSGCRSPRKPTRPSPAMRGSRRRPRPRRRGCRRSPMIQACASMRSMAIPASIRRAGRGRPKDFALAMRNVEEKLQAQGATTPEQRRAHFVSALCGRLARRRMSRTSKAGSTARSSGRRAARSGFGYDPMFVPEGMTRDLRRNGARREARDLASRRRLPRSSSMPSSEAISASMCIGPSARPNAPIAISTRMCAIEPVDRTGIRRRARARTRLVRAQAPAAAVVASIFFGGGTPSLMPPAAVARVLDTDRRVVDVSPRCRGDARSQSDQRRGGEFPRLSRRRRQSRLGRRAGARPMPISRRWDASIRSDEALAAFRLAARIFPRVSFDLIYARPGQTRGAMARRTVPRSCRAAGPYVALSAHHRAGHALCRSASRAESSSMPDEDTRSRALRASRRN